MFVLQSTSQKQTSRKANWPLVSSGNASKIKSPIMNTMLRMVDWIKIFRSIFWSAIADTSLIWFNCKYLYGTYSSLKSIPRSLSHLFFHLQIHQDIPNSRHKNIHQHPADATKDECLQYFRRFRTRGMEMIGFPAKSQIQIRRLGHSKQHHLAYDQPDQHFIDISLTEHLFACANTKKHGTKSIEADQICETQIREPNSLCQTAKNFVDDNREVILV